MRPYQRDLIADPAREVVVVSATQIGKTTACACWSLAQAWQRPGSRGWWTAPTYSQAETGYDRIKSLARSAGVLGHHVDHRLRLTLSQGSVIEAKSWERDDNLLGTTIHHLVVDEAGLLTRQARAIIASRLSGTLGPSRYIGNPTVTGSEFWNLCTQAQEEEESALKDGRPPRMRLMRWTWRDRAETLEGEGRTIYEAFIETQKQDLFPGEFARLYEAEWSVPEEAVFSDVMDRLFTGDPDPRPHPGHDYLIGWDIGFVNDYTVGAPLCLTCMHVHHVIRTRPGTSRGLAELIRNTCREFNDAAATIEVNGPGRPIFDEVLDLWPDTAPWTTTSANKRGAVFEAVRLARSGGLTLCNDGTMMQEFRVFQSKRSALTGTWTFQAPDGAKDDIVMAVLIAVGSATSGAAAHVRSLRAKVRQQATNG